MNFSRLLGLLKENLPADPIVRTLHNSYKNQKILVQCVTAPYYYALFGNIVRSIQKIKTVDVDLFILRSIDGAVGSNLRSFAFRLFPLNWLMTKSWVNAYLAFSNKVGYRSSSWMEPVNDFRVFLSAFWIWKKLRAVEDLAILKIDNLFCGDLIIDTYLRFKPAVTVKINDYFLLYLIWQSCRDISRSRSYFTREKPTHYLSSYSTYIQHGIAVRVALENNVNVFVFGNHQQIAKKLSSDDFYHTKNPRSYKADFEAINDKESRLKQAQEQLELRLSGGIDAATSYMAQSAYSKNNLSCPYVNGAAVIFLHDFYDSPHVYAKFIFNDFWQWTCTTIEALENNKIQFFIKPHPNQIELSSHVLDDLRLKYPKIQIIPSTISNRQLVDGGMSCGLTAYGTVAHELAYMGVPSITCASHPHVSFDFCHNATTITEYKMLISRISQLSFQNPSEIKKQVLQFYVMHNLNLSEDDLIARTTIIDLWKLFINSSDEVTEIIKKINDLSELKGFRNLIDDIFKNPNHA